MQKVAVHIVTYNNEDTIDLTLEALSKQSGDWVIQIIDNASTDNTCGIITNWGFPLLKNQSNVGYAAAHNQALLLTESQYVLTLNPDVTLQTNFIQEMVNVLDSNRHLGMASGCLLRVDKLRTEPHTIDSTGIYLLRNGRQGLRAEGQKVEHRPTEQVYIFGADGAAAFYRRQMLDDICLTDDVFDEDYFIHKEDIDICWRAQWRGWKTLYIPDAIAHHVRTFRPSKRTHVAKELRYYGLRNRYILMIKNQALTHFILDLPFIAFYELKIWVYVLLFERSSFKVPININKNWVRWRNKRHNIKKSRLVELSELRQWYHHKELAD